MRIRKIALSDLMWNKKPEIYTKEEMIELLKQYKNILNTTMIDYLDSLIELKIPVTKELISSDVRESLSELDVYKKVVTYNIYNIVSNLTKAYEESGRLNFDVDTSGFYVNLDNVEVFSYYLVNDVHNYNIMDLYQTVRNEEKVKEEIERVMNKLDSLNRQHNPFGYSTDPYGYPVVGGPGDYWAGNHQSEIASYENLLKKLESKTELTKFEEKEIEITSKLHQDLIEVFNLDLNTFKDQECTSFYGSKTKLQKRMVKCMPHLNIVDNIKYV